MVFPPQILSEPTALQIVKQYLPGGSSKKFNDHEDLKLECHSVILLFFCTVNLNIWNHQFYLQTFRSLALNKLTFRN